MGWWTAQTAIHPLGGDRKDQGGIRRICFRWAFAEDPTGKDPLMIPGAAVDVEIVDSP